MVRTVAALQLSDGIMLGGYLTFELNSGVPLLVCGFGLLLILSLAVKIVLQRWSLPPVLGYLLLGVLVSGINQTFSLVDERSETLLSFLAALGVIVLLFRVGIESDLHALVRELPKASLIWLPNMALGGIPVYFVVHYYFDFAVIPSLFAGVAMTATSVGVSVAVWKDHGKLASEEGELLVDTAELDDISGVALMALLFSIAPVLHEGGVEQLAAIAGDSQLKSLLLSEAVKFAVSCAVFIVVIIFAGKALVGPLTALSEKFSDQATVLILVVACGILIAGLAGGIGLSLPIGALFAGLLVSRHRENYGVEPFYRSLDLIFVPFFFIHIGFQVDPSVVSPAVGIGLALTLVAVFGKLLGTGVPARLFTGGSGALMVGISMVPRAEIAMVVVERGSELGAWAMPPELYAGLVFVCAATCLGTAVFLNTALRTWRPSEEQPDARRGQK
ncbi:cation:proton antiporter [bacterium]|nr:cation:proton antiporter [bacterium]